MFQLTFFFANAFFGNNRARMLLRGRNTGLALGGYSLDQECSFSVLSPLPVGTVPSVPLYFSWPSGCSFAACLSPASLYSSSQAVVALFSCASGQYFSPWLLCCYCYGPQFVNSNITSTVSSQGKQLALT